MIKPLLPSLSSILAKLFGVAANQTATKEWDISLLTFEADGQKLLDVPVVQPLTTDLAHAIAVAVNGQFVIAGVATTKTGSDQTVVRFDAKGSLLSSGPIVGSSAKKWTGAFALKGGEVLLGGDQRVTRIDAAGTLVWGRVVSSINVHGFAELSDGGWMVVGTSGTQLGAARLAPNGVKWWLQSWGGPMGDQGWGLALLPSGAMGLAGGNCTEGKGYSDAWLFRTDAFANPSCTESGICASKTATGCDDSEFCNVNTCAAATGCKTNKLYGNPVCGDGMKCTDAGVCQ
ncbi:MAG: hypothetical protein EXR77_02820 [Myxococcales bacterium]|nr:hypothetical protein [Myxococcales bacterium]